MQHEPIPHPKDLLDFSGKVVIVTGSGSGLGGGVAMRFAQAGAAVTAHYMGSQSGAEAIATSIREMGGQAITAQADVRVAADIERLVAETVSAFGRLDVIINNAGVYPLSPLLEMSEEEWDLVIDSNLKGIYLCTQIAARQMIAQGGGGAIVNISSIEGENPAPRHSHYIASKGGVNMFSMASALELAPHGIRVNTVSPGLIWREGIEQGYPDGVVRWQKNAALVRLGMPEDIGDACLFLASPAARWITGVNLRVDGGVMTHQIY